MKKIILLIAILLTAISWQTNAQAVEDNFDSYAAGNDPTGWTKYQTETDDPGFIVTDSESNSAPNSLYHNDDNITNESTSWIVAPVYVATGNDMLDFFYRQNYTPSYYNYSGVWYSTTGSDPIQNPGDWIQIAEFNGTDQPYSEDTWTKFIHSFTETAGTNIYIAFKYTGKYQHEFYIDDFKIDVAPAYLIPEFSLELTDVDCGNSQFSVNVNVTDFGGANSVTVTDDQGSALQQLSTPGIVTFGPYTDGTNVSFSVTNDDDTSFTSTDAISYTCPTNNDDCYNATDLTVYDVGMGVGNETAIDAANYTDSGVHSTCDDFGTNLDMWFKVTVPVGETGFKANYTGDKASKVESALWDGCGGNEIVCFDYSSNASHTFSGLTAGTTYYLQLWLDSGNAGTFNIVIEKLSPPPANDTCSGAISLPLDPDTCTNSVFVNNTGSTDSGVPAPSCGSYSPSSGNGDLWYTVVIPTDVDEITLNVSNIVGLTSVAGALYSGDCNNLDEISCTEFGSGWPWSISGLTAGDTYFLRVWDYNNDQLGSFDLCGYYTLVSVADNKIEGFKFYPNPVNHTLNLSAKDNIEMISISNVMGQEVLHLLPNATETQVNMSSLQNGIYFVKAQINGELTAFKVIKK